MQDKKLVWPALIIGVSLIIAVFVMGQFYLTSKTALDSISVTGSATKLVESDTAKLRVSILRKVDENQLGSGYKEVASDINRVKAFVMEKGFSAEEMTVNPVFVNEVWRGEYSQGPREYELRQEIQISSDKVAEVTNLSSLLSSLGEQGIFIQIFAVEYYYSGLPEARIELLGEAMSDAKNRAEQLVTGMGKKVSGLKSASSGVVQVRQPNSVEVSDYGMYDTSSMEKEIMVTVRADFLTK